MAQDGYNERGAKGGGKGKGNTSSDIVNYSSNLQPSAHDDEGHLCKQRAMSERARETDSSGPAERSASHLLIRPPLLYTPRLALQLYESHCSRERSTISTQIRIVTYISSIIRVHTEKYHFITKKSDLVNLLPSF